MQINAINKLLAAALFLAGLGMKDGYSWGGGNSRIYRKEITLSAATTSANYQALVTLATTNFNYAHAAASGGDLLFTDSSDSALEHWVENWDTNGDSKLWVKVAVSDTSTLRLYYGDPAATNGGTVASNVFVRVVGVSSQVLKGAWTFDETSGTNVYDSSGGTNHGTVIVATITNGKFGNARFFYGGTDTVQTINIGSAPSCNFSNSDFSIEAWVKPTSNSAVVSGVVMGRYNAAPIWYSRINSGGNAFACRMRTASASENYDISSGSIATGVWTHLVVTYDRDGNMTRYANGATFGAAMDISPANGVSMWAPERLQIGSLSTVAIPSTMQIFNGAIDEPRVYGAALSAAEISDLYNYYGYTTTNYPGRVLVRQYATPEPSAALGTEKRLNRGTIFSTY